MKEALNNQYAEMSQPVDVWQALTLANPILTQWVHD